MGRSCERESDFASARLRRLGFQGTLPVSGFSHPSHAYCVIALPRVCCSESQSLVPPSTESKKKGNYLFQSNKFKFTTIIDNQNTASENVHETLVQKLDLYFKGLLYMDIDQIYRKLSFNNPEYDCIFSFPPSQAAHCQPPDLTYLKEHFFTEGNRRASNTQKLNKNVSHSAQLLPPLFVKLIQSHSRRSAASPFAMHAHRLAASAAGTTFNHLFPPPTPAVRDPDARR